MFCGVSKAFDWVWHKGLLYKLKKKIGLDCNFLGWLENYITNRKQAVVLDGYTSRTVSLNAVLTEGPLLGPFFYSYYTLMILLMKLLMILYNLLMILHYL